MAAGVGRDDLELCLECDGGRDHDFVARHKRQSQFRNAVDVDFGDSRLGRLVLVRADRRPGTRDLGRPESVELGVRFSTSVPGTVSGLRFYKNFINIGTDARASVGVDWKSAR